MTPSDTIENGKIPLYKPSQLPRRKKKRSAKQAEARRVLSKYTLIASGIGFIPAPLAGQLAVGGLLAKLMSDLCAIYGLSFSDHQIKITVTAVLSGAHYDWISHYLIKYVKGYTPLSASAGSLLIRPAVSGLLVYYIGKLFLLHLESGAWIRVKEKGFNL